MKWLQIQLMVVLEKRLIPCCLLGYLLYEFEQLHPHFFLLFYALNEAKIYSIYRGYRNLLHKTVLYPIHFMGLLGMNTSFSFLCLNIALYMANSENWLEANLALSFASSIGIICSNSHWGHATWLGIPLLRLMVSSIGFLGLYQMLPFLNLSDGTFFLFFIIFLSIIPFVAWKQKVPILRATYRN